LIFIAAGPLQSELLHTFLSKIYILFKMKKIYLFIPIFIISAIDTTACEICGCGNNNFQIGILPSFTKGFAGVRYSASQFSSQLKADATQFSHDYYKTTELWGGYNFGRLQAMVFLPYVLSRKESDDGTTVANGLGDLLLLVNYKVFGSTSLSQDETTSVRNELYAGGGIKLPTGVNRVDVSNPDFNIGDFNSQAGTGSVDYLVNLTHNVMWNRSGIVTNVAYRINSENDQGYRFGNRSYLNTAYFYTLSKAGTKIKPSAGINFQSNAINSYSGAEVEDSNGYNLNATAGVNVLWNKLGFNAMFFIPVAQNNYDGQTKLQSRSLFGVTYSF
jgi:hypothetical protein